jgi:hypothetical protein
MWQCLFKIDLRALVGVYVKKSDLKNKKTQIKSRGSALRAHTRVALVDQSLQPMLLQKHYMIRPSLQN